MGKPVKTPRRIFIGVCEIAGYYRRLASGFDQLGVPYTLVDFSDHGHRVYGPIPETWLVRTIRRLATRSTLGRWISWLLRIPLLLSAALRHDVFLFTFATSLLPRNYDLRFLKLLGKKIVFQFHGSDSRVPFLDGAALAVDAPVERCIELTRIQKGIIRHIDRWADLVIDIQPQSHFHERPCVQWLRVGLPVPVSAPVVALAPPEGRMLRVLHAPSNPVAKGTVEVRAAVERAKKKGLPLEYVEIRGQPNSVVLAELERADIVIDQMYADYGMPGLASEAAKYGRAVIIAGYAAHWWKEWLPAELQPPTHYCRPEEIDAAIERLATDAAYRAALGRRAREFVETHWSPRAVAEKYLALFAGDVPADWVFDPKDIRYWEGACNRESDTRARIRRMVEAGGPATLQVADKPELEKLLLDVAGGGNSSVARDR